MYYSKINVASLPWCPLDFPGVSMKTLHSDVRSGGMTVVTKMAPGASIPAHCHTHADETVFVLEGEFIEDGISHGPGTLFTGAAGTFHGPHGTEHGCILLTTFSAALDFVLSK